MIRITKHVSILDKNWKSYHKNPHQTKAKAFYCQSLSWTEHTIYWLQETVNIQTGCSSFFALHLRQKFKKGFEVMKNVKTLTDIERNRRILSKTFFLLTMLDKIYRERQITKQNPTRAENIDFCFPVIFDCYCQNIISEVDISKEVYDHINGLLSSVCMKLLGP